MDFDKNKTLDNNFVQSVFYFIVNFKYKEQFCMLI